MKLLKVTRLEARREERGWSVEPAAKMLAAGKLKNIHVVSMEPGTIRGNHVHSKQLEYAMVFGGRCLVAVENEAGEREQMIIGPDDLCLFEIQPHIKHAFKNIGEETMFLIAFTDTPYDHRKPDVEPAQVITPDTTVS
jgi:dTDP-4-dehydrorhamnose 3,5-epimerase-like enzyme